MGLIRFVVWTALCVSLGVWLGSGQVAGKTPLEHLERAWKGPAGEKFKDAGDKFKDGAQEWVTDVKKQVNQPKERHTAEDRAAIDDIIAKRPAKDGSRP